MFYHFSSKERFDVWNDMLKLKLGYPRASYNAATGAILAGPGTTDHVRGVTTTLPGSTAVLVSIDEPTIPDEMRVGAYSDSDMVEYSGDLELDGFIVADGGD